MNILIIIAAILISFAIGVPAGMAYRKKIAESKIQGAENEAKRLVDLAKIEAENLKKAEIFKAKEEIMNNRKELDQEIKERRGEIQKQEARLIQKEENLEKRSDNFEKKEQEVERELQDIERQKEEIVKLHEQEIVELQKIASLSKEEAKERLLAELDKELTAEKAAIIREKEQKAKEEATKNAKELLTYAVQKCAADHSQETTVSIVSLPNDEMKGRIIGREGRNIKALETLTGIDLIIDDTPEAIVLSSFDPYRREIARVTIESLIKDGRIHPGRIEEIYDKTAKDMKSKVLEYGQSALFELGITKMEPELVELVGKLHFRTSYGQNALTHSIEVGHLAGIMAAELGENQLLAKRAGLLHDIGKAIDHEVEGSHVELGSNLANKYKENQVVINAIESHHGDKEATSVISVLVGIADALSASRPGARNDSLENYVQRLQELEKIGNEMEGVEKSYAMQAGRELRVIVKPDKIDDATSYKVARDIKNKIEEQLQYPGTIKVIVIRETRAQEEAK